MEIETNKLEEHPIVLGRLLNNIVYVIAGFIIPLEKGFWSYIILGFASMLFIAEASMAAPLMLKKLNNMGSNKK